MFKGLTVALITLLTIVAAYAAEQPRQFSCTGAMIERTGLSTTPKTARLALSSSKKLAIDIDGSHINARVVSDNKIQLKFETKKFFGEYFYYSGDLFLIYKSGHLARLTCKQD